MKKSGVVITALLVLIAVVLVSAQIIQKTIRPYPVSIKYNVRDLPEYGLHIVSPSQDAFNKESFVLSQGNKEMLDVMTGDVKPFSCFLVNKSEHKVVAYRVRWELLKADGNILTFDNTHGVPDFFMGEHTRLGAMPANESRVIDPNATRFLSLIDVKLPDSNTGLQVQSGGVGKRQVSESGSQSLSSKQFDFVNEQAKYLKEELSRATSLTISLDGAFFDDGTFVGLNTSKLFEEIKAQVKANRDLLEHVARVKKSNQPLSNAFSTAEAVMSEESPMLNPSGTPAEQYKFYSRIFAMELLRMRKMQGDEKAVEMALRPLSKTWIELKKAGTVQK